MTIRFGQIISYYFKKKPISGMAMIEVHLYKRTDGGKFKNNMESSEESGYGNLVKKCQTHITSPHSKSFLAGLPSLISHHASLLITSRLQGKSSNTGFMSLCPSTFNALTSIMFYYCSKFPEQSLPKFGIPHAASHV